jgi:hypothetical protein
MADTPTFQSNPYGSFDPSQWSNPYSQFYGKALPWPSTYAGTPTNALGQPIAVPQGMTLNNTPAQPQAPAAAAPPPVHGAGGLLPGQWDGPDGLPAGTPTAPIRLATTSEGMPPGETSLGRGVIGGSYQPNGFMAPQQQQPQAPMAAPPAGNNWQTSLAMLANPGQVTTPGATVPQAPQGSAQPSPGVLQNFLANWQPAQSGPGSGFAQNFNTILRGLQAQKKGS